MSTKFVLFTNPQGNKPVLVNPAHVRTASESGSAQVTLVMDHMHGGYQDVVGDLKSVCAMLTGESDAPSHAPEPPPNAPMSIDLTLP
jgi:hypothetical protein